MKFLTLVTTCLLFCTIAPSVKGLNVEVFHPDDRGHFVSSGIISGKKSVMIIDAQLSLTYGQYLAERVKALNKEVKAIFISHGHIDHYTGLEELTNAFPNAEVFASQHSIDRMKHDVPMATNPNAMRPYPNNLGVLKKVIIPKPYDKDTYVLDGETIQLKIIEQGDTEKITTFDIPSKGTSFRPHDAKSKRDITWMPSNGTYWASDVVMSGTHFLMEELESKAAREAWTKNCKEVKEFVMKNNRSIVPGHFDNRNNMTTEQMLDHPINYIAAYEKALQYNTSDKFWDSIMSEHADDGLMFLIDWSQSVFYNSQRKTPVP